jgi:hypothetical protein
MKIKFCSFRGNWTNDRFKLLYSTCKVREEQKQYLHVCLFVPFKRKAILTMTLSRKAKVI